jgi:hypothetical protein
MDWGKIFMLLQIAELSRGYGVNSHIQPIHEAALHELSNIASSAKEPVVVEEPIEEVEETDDE